MKMRLNWIKNNQGNGWFDFLKLNLDSAYFNNLYGIYIIWYTSPAVSKVVKIGTGYIGEKLKTDRTNSDILKYSQFGQLKVTWAVNIPQTSIPGAVASLNDIYSPVLGEGVPLSVPREDVNLIGE